MKCHHALWGFLLVREQWAGSGRKECVGVWDWHLNFEGVGGELPGEGGTLHRSQNPIRGEKSAVRFGPKLARFDILGFVEIGSNLAQIWLELGFPVDPNWLKIGSNLARIWLEIGSKLALKTSFLHFKPNLSQTQANFKPISSQFRANRS